jgi:quercetin dioxygenase-like cupin family protein
MSTTTSYATIALHEAAHESGEQNEGRGRVRIRRDLGISSFGVNAFHQATAGERLVGEHDELGPGSTKQEELYVVIAGSATFTIDGETVAAPNGTALLVPPEAKRSAVAEADGTIVLVVGGTPGEAYKIGAGEAMGPFFEHYNEKDYAGALAAVKAAFETHPGNALVYYNVACMESLLGHHDEALAALEESVTQWPQYKELAAADDDFASLREDARFQALIA